MRILISNDDGIYSRNLHQLHAALRRAGHDVRAVAPAEQHSGAGCCLTVHGPILTRRVSLPDAAGGPFEGIAVAGTPADCVILALRGIMPDFKPDLVMTGINFGPNAGQDVFFSGTVGAAIQSAMYGLPTLAVSHCSYSGATPAHADLAARRHGLGTSAQTPRVQSQSSRLSGRRNPRTQSMQTQHGLGLSRLL